jgi:hypothetical protein
MLGLRGFVTDVLSYFTLFVETLVLFCLIRIIFDANLELTS